MKNEQEIYSSFLKHSYAYYGVYILQFIMPTIQLNVEQFM